MIISRKEKVANQSAALTLGATVVSGFLFPAVVIGYLLSAIAFAAVIDRRFSVLLIVFLPLVTIYGSFYCLLEHKKIALKVKGSLETFKRHLL